MLKTFTPEIKLHPVLKQIIRELLADPPTEASLEEAELQDILDGQPAVDLLCDDSTFTTLSSHFLLFTNQSTLMGHLSHMTSCQVTI